MADFRTLEYDIKQMLIGNHSLESLELRPDTAKRIITLSKNIAVHTLDMVNHAPPKPKDHTDKSIRMSELGEPCYRKLIYKWYHPEFGLPPYAESPEPFLPVKFTFGDYIEELTLFLANESGHEVKDRQKTVNLKSSSSSWYAVGHIDAAIDDHVVDVKSAADGSFQKYKREGLREENDNFGYRWQLDAYATALSTSNRAFIFTNKHDGNIHIIDRSDEELLPVVDKIISIGSTVDEYLGTAVLPEKIPTKVTKYGNQLGVVCGYCNYKYSCYSGNVTGVIASGKPTYFETSSLTKEGKDFVESKAKIATPEAWEPPF